MTDALRYHGPAIAPDGLSVKTIEGEYVVCGEVKLATGRFYRLNDVRHLGDGAHTYSVYEADYLEAQGLSAS